MKSPGQRYLRLPQQVAHLIVERIKHGQWSRTLPNERHLAAELNVSRRTIRASLAELRREGWAQTARGRGTQILRKANRRGNKAVEDSVGLILPDTLANLRHQTFLWTDALRTILFDAGYRLEVHPCRGLLTTDAARTVERIVRRSSHRAWLLSFSGRAAQKWFADAALPCVVVGVCHADVRLPSIGTDNRAVCRHAVLRMAALGHKRIAFLTERSARVGDQESVRGFREGAEACRDRGVIAEIVNYRRDTDHVAQVAGALLSRRVRPTALLISNPDFMLTVVCVLGRLGLKIPRDISLLCRDDDHCLRYLHPAAARYTWPPEQRAHRIFRLLSKLLAGEILPPERHVIMPTAVKGGTLQPPQDPIG